ncbi:MAG: chromosomal replication initiator protein DnaA [Planctomycetes bacterium]|nr:chromosomal replication initiator protein DnaA [Planctomycetota bacterium]
MQSTVTDEISAINKALTEKIGSQKFRIWFKNSTRMTLADGYLKIGVPNPFIASWIENHFENDITHAVKEVTENNVKITFAIDPQLSGHQRRTVLDSQADRVSKMLPGVEKNKIRAAAKQKRKLKLSFDTFVVGSSNELAYNAALAVAKQQNSPFNPLFIHGGYGVGKTHLMQGICNQVSKTRPETNWLYLSAEDFVNQFVLALKTKKLEAFRRRMRQTDLLAIDDIHFLASKPSTQEEFLHTFNTIDMAGKQIILVSDAHPKMIGQISEKLVNRFVSGMVAKIDAPDLATRCEICRRYTAAMKKPISEPVTRYIAENIKSNVRELEGALLKLAAYSGLQNTKITLNMAKEVLGDHIARTDPIVHVGDIELVVATFFGITPANLHSSKKDRTVSLARHFSMYLARKHTKMSFPEIGRCMGNKNHATVLLACKKIQAQVETNAQIRWNGPNGNRIAKAKNVLESLEQSISS